MSKILFTTTPTVEVGKITAYYGIVNTSVVLGVNVISDVVASFSDFFGGRSGEYQGKLDTIFSDIMKNLTEKAQRTSSKINAVVGLSIDFDEISGKGKQMFMATAVGTMCTVEYEKEHEEVFSTAQDTITYEEIEISEKSTSIEKELMKSYRLSDEYWQFVFTHPSPKISSSMAEVMNKIQTSEYRTMFRSNFIQYLSALPIDIQKEIVYDKLENKVDQGEVISKLRLFDANRILAILESGDIQRASWNLDATQATYTMDDLTAMKKLVEALDNLPDKGELTTEESKSIFGKSEEKHYYICPEGHKNDANITYCEHTGCGLDIKGRTYGNLKKIEKFKHRVELLEKLFEEKK